MSKNQGKRGVNTYFRQTAKAFKAARQTQIFSHINRNLPHRIYKYSKYKFSKQKTKIDKGLKATKNKWARRVRSGSDKK